MNFENASAWSTVTPKNPTTLPQLAATLSDSPQRVNATWTGLLGVVAEEILTEGDFPADVVLTVVDNSAELIAIKQITTTRG